MIKDNVSRILADIPEGVQVVAVTKGKSAEEALEAVESGISIIGENYLQEALKKHREIGKKENLKWHFTGHLQKNKVKKAVRIFDMIQTVDSAGLAEEIDRQSGQIGKVMPVLIEYNSGREESKSGVMQEAIIPLVTNLSKLSNIRISGLMTIGAFHDEPEEYRPFFKEARNIFETVRSMKIPGVDMKYLSMGMSGSYKIAIEEGANIVRIGTLIFGERK